MPSPVFPIRAALAAAFASCVLAFAGSAGAAPSRLVHSLDGIWQIADGKSPDEIPAAFPATVPVPGLANLATPAFKDVDQFLSRELFVNLIQWKNWPVETMTEHWNGWVKQDRNYFWYHRRFRAPAKRDVALLKINKAQFGTAVWLNGRKLGEYPGCFSASCHRLNDAIRWNAENTLVIRIGAHPAVLPDNYLTGQDYEKNKWTPGIYDSVSLIYCDNPVIEMIQVAPRIVTSEVVIHTQVKNHGAALATAWEKLNAEMVAPARFPRQEQGKVAPSHDEKPRQPPSRGRTPATKHYFNPTEGLSCIHQSTSSAPHSSLC